jgi:hypothetical protein
MADLFDQAQDRDAQQLAEALQAQTAKAAATPKLAATGECLNPKCGEPLEGGKLFCNSDCAAEHHRYTRN